MYVTETRDQAMRHPSTDPHPKPASPAPKPADQRAGVIKPSQAQAHTHTHTHPRSPAPPPLRQQPFASAQAGEVVDADTQRAQTRAMLPAQLLQPGEVIVLLLKPSPWFMVLVPMRFIAIVLLSATLAVLFDRRGYSLGIGQNDLAIVTFGLVCARLFWQALEWLSHVYVLTDQRVIRVQGVLSVQVFQCPLQNIQQTDLILPLTQRIFWLGTLGFATAGTAMHEAYWFMVAKPLEVHATVVQTLQRYRR